MSGEHLTVQKIFRAHVHIKNVNRCHAKLGGYAITPALYARQGDMPALSDIGPMG